MKIDATVRRETMYIAAWVLIFSMITEAVFLLIHRWDITVLLGNLLGASASLLNFFLLGLTVQGAVQKEPKEAATAIKASQRLRLLMLFAVALIGFLLPILFNRVALLLSLFFPRIAIVLRPLFDRWGRQRKEGPHDEE